MTRKSKHPQEHGSDSGPSVSRRQILKYSGALLGASLLPKVSAPGFMLSGQNAMSIGTTDQAASGAPRTANQTGAVGFVLSHEQFPAPQLVELAAAADTAGFDSVWTSDHYHPWQDNEGHAGQAWVTLSAVGQRTKFAFGTGVTCPTFRYRPAIVAEAFATLGLLYPGRVFLGVGTGEALNEVPGGGGWGKYAERAARLTEAVQLIKQLWTGQSVTFNGKYYQVSKSRLYDLPTSPVPLYIAAAGPKSMELSGQYGDGLISDSKSVLDPQLREAWDRGAKKAGKDSSTMPILAEAFVFVGSDKDPELAQAAEQWRFTPKAWTNFVNNPDPVDIHRQADQVVPLEEVYNRWTVSADPADHAKALQALFDGGVTQIYVHSGQADQRKVVDFYGKQVLPLLRNNQASARSGSPATTA